MLSSLATYEISALLQAVFNLIFYYSSLAIVLATINIILQVLYSRLKETDGEPVKLYFKESAFSRFLMKRVSQLTDPYCPPPWCNFPSVQLLTSPYLLSKPVVRFTRQFLQLKDRGLVALDWALPSTAVCNMSHCVWTNLKKRSPVLVVLPDFDGNAMSLGSVCNEALSRGFRPVVFNRRGQGDCPLTTPKLQQYSDPSDLRQAVLFVRSCSPHARLVALGYGVGADLLLAYLGEFGSSSFVSASSAISPIYDPELIYKQGIRPVYDFLLKISFRRFVYRNAGALFQSKDLRDILRQSNLLEAERLLHLRLSDSSVEEELYWERNAPLRDADDIASPLLCITSLDDPFLAEKSIPYEIFQVYPNVMLAVTERGGHGSFLQGTPNNEGVITSWADTLALDFIKTTLEFATHEEKMSKHSSM